MKQLAEQTVYQWEKKIFIRSISNKKLMTIIYKDLLKFNSKPTKKPNKKMQKTLKMENIKQNKWQTTCFNSIHNQSTLL